MELRNRIRYRLSADAVFAWEGPQHNRLQGKGITRDISLAGAFIFTPTTPPVGANVELDIFLIPVSRTAGKKVRIRAAAKVTRVEHSVTGEGFAAISQDLKLLFNFKGREQLCISTVEGTPEDEDDETEESSIQVQEADVKSLLRDTHDGPH